MIVAIKPERAHEIIEKISKAIVSRRMSSAAIMTIESLRPLNFIGSQVLFFLEPFAQIFINSKEYQEFAALLENDEYVKKLVRRIDELDEETYHEERKRARLKQKRRWNKIKSIFSKKKK